MRRPVLHFALLGTLLFAFQAARPRAQAPAAAAPARPEVVITDADLARLRAEFVRDVGVPATAAQERGLAERAALEEILYREALARGLDQGDRSIRVRLVRKMGFLAEPPDGRDGGTADAGAADDETLYREALALGLAEDDAVVRRLLIEKMRLLLAYAGESAAPDEATLRAFLERNRDRFEQPARVTLWQVFLSAQERGPALEQDARDLLGRLRADGAAPRRAESEGDAFPAEAHLARRSHRDLAKFFGASFADDVLETPLGRWEGPVRSAFGLHLVFVEEREPARLPELEAVRRQLEAAVRAEQREARLETALAELRAKYDVRIDLAPREAPGAARSGTPSDAS